MDVGYVAVETFFPTENYKKWSKLLHIKEVVSLDCLLCPRIRDLLDDRKCLHGFYTDILLDLNLLLTKIKGTDREFRQILAVCREPESDCNCTDLLQDNRFRFYGYDLLEDYTRISALTNCGGFDKAFSPKDISEYGLIRDFDKAKQIQLLLSNQYPNEEHANCAIWAIWRME